ncbi:MAG TPA: class I SAM-dependent methyltransferase [Solirubrobacteraceae bacterium]|nr:class I SAM-dependent methyltransferase [Solirubrobacteraceae bacterium]
MDVTEYYREYWSSGRVQTAQSIDPRLQGVLGELVLDPRRACLDFGCGEGSAAAVWLAERARRYVGVDVSEAAVARARGQGLDARLIAPDEGLPFGDGEFDLVVALEVLEHLFDPAAAVSELLRVLRPGGRLLVTVPNVAYWRRRIDLAVLGRWNPLGDSLSVKQPWRDPHLRFFSVSALRRLLEYCGLACIVVGGHGDPLEGIPAAARSAGGRVLGRLSRRIQTSRRPQLLSPRLHAVATKPADGRSD